MAQKLLNMTIKNLLLAEDMFNRCTGYENILKDNRANFHVPVDKNILEILEATKNDFGIKGSNMSWSNWNEEDYTDFTENLNEKIKDKDEYSCPLD